MNPPLDRKLTPRQIQVLTLLASGFTTKEIAERLGIGFRSADTHREDIRRRLGISSVALLTQYATARGLVTNPFITHPQEDPQCSNSSAP